MANEFKSGFCNIYRTTKRWKVNINEPSDRTEDRDHIKQTADNKKSYPDSVHR